MEKFALSSYKGISRLLFLLPVLCLLALSACEEDDPAVSQGPPVIERIRLSDPATADSSLTRTILGNTLVIVGQNLGSTQAVFLNNYQVALNAAYTTDHYLIVGVPDSVPTVAIDPDVPDEIRVVNPYGEVTYPFQILPPAPIVDQISNQYAGEGETITLYGRYFFFVDTVSFPGDVKVTEGFTTSTNGNTLTIEIPQGFDPSDGDIRIVSQSGSSRPNRATRFFDGDGMLADFDTNGPFSWPDDWGWGIPNDNITNTTPGIEPIDNHFAMINMTLPPNWGWANEKVVNLVDWGGEQIYPTIPAGKYDPGASIANFDARMEIAVSTAASIEGIELQIMYPNENNTELTVNVPLSDFVRSTDGKWYTISVPLSNLANGNTKLSTYGDLLKPNADGQHHFRVVIVNPTVDPVPVVMGIDNIRIVNAIIQ